MEKKKYVTPACTVNEVEMQGMIARSIGVENEIGNYIVGRSNKNNFTDIWGNEL